VLEVAANRWRLHQVAENSIEKKFQNSRVPNTTGQKSIRSRSRIRGRLRRRRPHICDRLHV